MIAVDKMRTLKWSGKLIPILPLLTKSHRHLLQVFVKTPINYTGSIIKRHVYTYPPSCRVCMRVKHFLFV